MLLNTENKFAKESKIQIENLDFHVLVMFRCCSDEEIPIHETLLHTHVFYELFVCKQGEVNIKTTQGDIFLSSGDIVIIPPTQAHVLKHTAKNTETYIISFLCKKAGNEDSVNLYKKLASIVNSEIHIFKNRHDFISGIEKIVKESFLESTDNFWGALHLLELLLRIAKEKNDIEMKKGLNNKKGEMIPNDIERMIKLENMIGTWYLQNYQTADYAKELFISTRQLDRISIKRYGKSLHQLIVDRRLTFAEQLLLTTDLTVDTIASNAGFSSGASLYRELKKRHGVTPTQFRRQKDRFR